MRMPAVLGLAALLSCISFCSADDKPRFADILIDEPFRPFLISNPLLMEVTGTKVIREKKKRVILLSVASTVLKENSPSERLRAEKVCRVKALTGIVAEKQGIQVCHTEVLNEKTKVVIDEKEETGRNVSELLQVTQLKVEGITKDMPVIGRWRSEDGKVFYLAIGTCLNETGAVIEFGKRE